MLRQAHIALTQINDGSLRVSRGARYGSIASSKMDGFLERALTKGRSCRSDPLEPFSDAETAERQSASALFRHELGGVAYRMIELAIEVTVRTGQRERRIGRIRAVVRPDRYRVNGMGIGAGRGIAQVLRDR